MNKKKLAKSVVGIALIVSVAILIVVCVGKIKHIQNKKILLVHGRMQMQRKCLPFKKMEDLL
ncbi:hypothetical protein [Agathobacter rectalis]|uniref:Uncharacterized protein n=1 Tax=Agathobacter rectalis TaxID=39491 RepID=A0A173UKS0_9FIRM|nr:hypothetical protein [Agathobacter rectalis]CUN14158.1 Uncharacterised protein [Agathobacter rectalis]